MRFFLFFFLFVHSAHAWWGDIYDANGKITGVSEYNVLRLGGANLKALNFYRSKAYFQTSNLIFVPITPNHEEAFFWLMHHKKACIYAFDGNPMPRAYRQWFVNWVNDWDIRPFSWWMIYEEETGALIGTMGLDSQVSQGRLTFSCVMLEGAILEKDYLFEAVDQGLMGYCARTPPFMHYGEMMWSMGPDDDATNDFVFAFLLRLGRRQNLRCDHLDKTIFSGTYNPSLPSRRCFARFDPQKLLAICTPER